MVCGVFAQAGTNVHGLASAECLANETISNQQTHRIERLPNNFACQIYGQQWNQTTSSNKLDMLSSLS